MMINKILCKIGKHSWVCKTTYIPSISAKIVTRMTTVAICKRCDKKITLADYHFDPETGDSINTLGG